jgi:hypothetical protein
VLDCFGLLLDGHRFRQIQKTLTMSGFFIFKFLLNSAKKEVNNLRKDDGSWKNTFIEIINI